MRRLTFFTAIAAALAAPAAAEQPASHVELPGWMAGGWVMEAPSGAWSEEWWTPPRAGLMMGAGRSGKGAELGWWEQTRIERADGKLRFCALPKGQAMACFAAVKIAADEIVFENPAHDFPTRVASRKQGQELLAEISGPGGANPQRWRFKRAN